MDSLNSSGDLAVGIEGHVSHAFSAMSHVVHKILHIIKEGFDGRFFFLSSTFYLSMAANGSVLSSSFCSLFMQTFINSPAFVLLPGAACLIALSLTIAMIALSAIASISEGERECRQRARDLSKERQEGKHHSGRHGRHRKGKKGNQGNSGNRGSQGDQGNQGDSREDAPPYPTDAPAPPLAPDDPTVLSIETKRLIGSADEHEHDNKNKDQQKAGDEDDTENDSEDFDDWEFENDPQYEKDIIECPLRVSPNVTCRSYGSSSPPSSVYGINKFHWYSIANSNEKEYDIGNCYPQFGFGTNSLAFLLVRGYAGLKYDYHSDTATVIISTLPPSVVEEQMLSSATGAKPYKWLGFLNPQVNWISMEYHKVLSTPLQLYQELHSALLANEQNHWFPLRTHYCICSDSSYRNGSMLMDTNNPINTRRSRTLLADLTVNDLAFNACSVQDCWNAIATLQGSP